MTSKYGFRTIPYGVTNWVSIINSNFSKVEEHLHSRFTVTVGASISARKPIYLASDGKWYLADRADAAKRPCLAVTLTAVSAQESVVVARRGVIYFSGVVPGQLAYLGTGDFTLSDPGTNRQIVGYGIMADYLFVNLNGIII